MQNFKEFSIIIVNYKSGHYLEKCLTSIFRQIKNKDFEIIVVNNDNGVNLSVLTRNFPSVKIIEVGKNIGFGEAANLGAKNSRGKWLWFLNPDTELLSDYSKILSSYQKDEAVGIIGPGLVDEKNKFQKWIAGSDATVFDLIGNNLGFPRSRKVWESQEPQETAWVSGAAMAVKRNLFEKLGGFDGKMFMYFEDIDICKRARTAGKKVVYFPKEKIRHFGSGSSESKKEQKKHYYESQNYYFQKHYGKNYARLVRFLRKIFTRENV
jgi:GT2 family glycosyltransferase